MAKTVLKENDVTVDYPQQGETIVSASYVIRIGAAERAKVEVSLDGGPWQPCRFSVGYWWFDWSGYLPGRHQVRAQIHTEDGHVTVSRPKEFTVSLGDGD